LTVSVDSLSRREFIPGGFIVVRAGRDVIPLKNGIQKQACALDKRDAVRYRCDKKIEKGHPVRIRLLLFSLFLALIFLSARGQDTTLKAPQKIDSVDLLDSQAVETATDKPNDEQETPGGLPGEVIAAIVLVVGGIVGLLLRWLLFVRPDQNLKERELDLKTNDDQRSEQDWLEKREAEIEKSRKAKKTYTSFEERYLSFMYEHHRYLEIQGIKTEGPLSTDLKKIYVALKAYKPAERLRKWMGDAESDEDRPSPTDEPDALERLHRDKP